MLSQPPNTSSPSSASVVGKLQQFGIDGLLGLLQNPDQLAGLTDVARSEEGVGGAFVGAAGRAADAVDVVLGRVGVVVIDNKLDVLHVLKMRGGLRKRVRIGSGGGKDKHASGEKASTLAEKLAFVTFSFFKFTYQRQLQHRAVNTLVLELLLNSQIYPLNSKTNLVFSEMEEERRQRGEGGFEVWYLPFRDYKVTPVSPYPSPVLGGLQGQEESSQDKSSPWSHLATPPRHSQSWKSWPKSSSYGPKLLLIVSSFYPYEQDTFPAGLCGTLACLLLEMNDADVLIFDHSIVAAPLYQSSLLNMPLTAGDSFIRQP